MSDRNSSNISRFLPVNPYQIFARVLGSNSTLSPFVNGGGNQQSITGDNAIIRNDCYHNKIYSTDGPLTMTLPNGIQEGQTKKITFVHKGSSDANITISCPSLKGTFTQISFEEAGDQIELLWYLRKWNVLSTLNILNLIAPSPRIV